MTREEKLAYARGYTAGSRRAWPEHKPPLPPNYALAQLMTAASGLRDAVDSACGMFDPDDPFAVAMNNPINDIDNAMTVLTNWLRNNEVA